MAHSVGKIADGLRIFVTPLYDDIEMRSVYENF